MGTCQECIYSSLLFLPLYSAVRAPGPILSDMPCDVYTASQPNFNSLFCIITVCVLINQNEGIQLCHTEWERELFRICNSL